jgi:hypothetical protein
VRIRGSDGSIADAPWLADADGLSAAAGHVVVVKEELTLGPILQTPRVTAQRYTADGAPIDAAPIEMASVTGTSVGYDPTVVSNASTHLLLWYESFSSFLCGVGDVGVCFSHDAIAGRRLGTNGQVLDADTFELYDEAIAGIDDVEAGADGFAFTTRIDDGEDQYAAYTLDGAGQIRGEVLVPRLNRYDSEISVAFDGSRYAMVWKADPTDFVADVSGRHVLKLVRFTPDGETIDGVPVVVDETTGANGIGGAMDPGIAGIGGGRMLVAYTRRDTEETPWFVSVQPLVTTPGAGGGGGGTLPPPTSVPVPPACSAHDSPASAPFALVLVLVALGARSRARRNRFAHR